MCSSDLSFTAEQALIAAPDTVARLKPRRVFATRFDCAGQVAADDVRKFDGQRHRTAADVGVDWIEGDRAHFDQHFVRPRLRVGQFVEANDVGATGLGDECSFHSCRPC